MKVLLSFDLAATVTSTKREEVYDWLATQGLYRHSSVAVRLPDTTVAGECSLGTSCDAIASRVQAGLWGIVGSRGLTHLVVAEYRDMSVWAQPDAAPLFQLGLGAGVIGMSPVLGPFGRPLPERRPSSESLPLRLLGTMAKKTT